jgi:cell division protein FtsQ
MHPLTPIAPAAPATLDMESSRGGLLRRRKRNRRVAIQRRSLAVALASSGTRVWPMLLRGLRTMAKLVALAAAILACLVGGRWAIRHVIDSPQFHIRRIEFAPTPHLGQDDMVALAGVDMGDKLLEVDTDAVAARIASHPWVATVHASRRLPSSLVIDVTERRAVAVAALSGLYLIDENGRPFKRASMAEADGLPVLTGIERERFGEMAEVSAAAYREALAVLRTYRAKPNRPAVTEVNIDPAFGFTFFLFDGGAEIRLGRGHFGEKLAQLDQILEAVAAKEPGGLAALRIVHLDLPASERVPVLLRGGAEDGSALAKPTPGKPSKT